MVDFQKLLDKDKYFELRRILDECCETITIEMYEGVIFIDPHDEYLVISL